MNDEIAGPNQAEEAEKFAEKMLLERAIAELQFTPSQELLTLRPSALEALGRLPESFEEVRQLMTIFDIEADRIVSEIADDDMHALAQMGQTLVTAVLYRDAGLEEDFLDSLEIVAVGLESFAYEKKNEQLLKLARELIELASKISKAFPNREFTLKKL